ncbi:MAG: AraC family transcriptional regulator [Bacteroidota bacterium]
MGTKLDIMNIIALPQDLQINSDLPVQLYDYRSFQDSLRSKINLTKNIFSFLIKGTKEVITDDHIAKIENDHFLLIRSGNCLMTETLSTDQSYKSVLLFFTDEVLLDFVEKHQLHSQAHKKGASFFVCTYDHYIHHFVEALEQIEQLAPSLQRPLLMAKLEEILIYLTQKEGPAFINCLLKNEDPKIIRLKNVVENNKLNKLTLQELAFLSNMSLSTFKRTFFEQYQLTPIKWFQEKRLEHAAFQLRTQQKSPSELFEAAGYENLSNFVQAFKKKFGHTPKQYQLRMNI